MRGALEHAGLLGRGRGQVPPHRWGAARRSCLPQMRRVTFRRQLGWTARAVAGKATGPAALQRPPAARASAGQRTPLRPAWPCRARHQRPAGCLSSAAPVLAFSLQGPLLRHAGWQGLAGQAAGA